MPKHCFKVLCQILSQLEQNNLSFVTVHKCHFNFLSQQRLSQNNVQSRQQKYNGAQKNSQVWLISTVKDFFYKFHFQVTPKLPGLNPNATVFLSHKSPPADGQTNDTGQWDQQNDSGIGNSTNSGKWNLCFHRYSLTTVVACLLPDPNLKSAILHLTSVSS